MPERMTPHEKKQKAEFIFQSKKDLLKEVKSDMLQQSQS
jgi:hypothetical protein